MSASIPDPEGFAKTIVVAAISKLCMFGNETLLRRLLKKLRLLIRLSLARRDTPFPKQGHSEEGRKRSLSPSQHLTVGTTLFPCGYVEDLNDTEEKARSWARKLSWQLQGGRVE